MRFLLTFLCLACLTHPAFSADKESAFERVMRTGTIRCGYWINPPLIVKESNTGKLSGPYVDYLEEMAKSLDLKIEWAGEISLATYLQDVNQGKFDAECATGWPNALRGKQLEYITPIGYSPLYLWTKAGDTRFDNNIAAANDPKVRFVGHDGGSDTIAQQKYFPKATLVSLPGSAGVAEGLDQIRYGKADVVLESTSEAAGYNTANPGVLRRVISGPVRIIPITMSVGAGEFRFQSMLNTATEQMLNDGDIDRLMEKYKVGTDVMLRAAKPYEAAK